MAEEGPQQGDSDIVMEEEVEESMEMDEPSNINAPTPLLDKAFLQTSKAEAEDDRHSHASEESMDQNPPHDLDLNEDEFLGLATDISIPGGHSDDSVALMVSPKDDDLWVQYLYLDRHLGWSQRGWVCLNLHLIEASGVGFIWTHTPNIK